MNAWLRPYPACTGSPRNCASWVRYPAAEGVEPFVDAHNSDAAFSEARDWVKSLRERL